MNTSQDNPGSDHNTELLKNIADSLKGIHSALKNLTESVEGVAESIEKAHEPEGDLGVHLVTALKDLTSSLHKRAQQERNFHPQQQRQQHQNRRDDRPQRQHSEEDRPPDQREETQHYQDHQDPSEWRETPVERHDENRIATEALDQAKFPSDSKTSDEGRKRAHPNRRRPGTARAKQPRAPDVSAR